MFHLMTHSTHFMVVEVVVVVVVLLYGIIHMVKNHSDSDRRNMLPPQHGLLFPISSKGSFICTILLPG